MRGPWEPGRPVRFHRHVRLGSPDHQLPDALGRASAVGGSEEPTHTVVSPSEGDEARREGRTGVGASHSIDEAVEPFRGTPWREGDAVS